MSGWQRVDGALVEWNPGRPVTELHEYLQGHRILACVDSSSDAVRLRFLVDDEERVAVSNDETLASGIDLKDLIEDIGVNFGVIGYAGDHEILEEFDDVDDASAEGAASEQSCDESCDCHEETVEELRSVTILLGGVSDVASLSRNLGEPIVVKPLEGRSAVLTEEGDTFPTSDDWPKVPSLQVYGAEPRYAALYEDHETWIAVGWDSVRTLIPAGLGGEAAEALQGLARDEAAAELISSMGTGDAAAVEKALHPADGGPEELLGSLGLPSDLWEFLAGQCAAHEVTDVVVITPPSTGETLSLLVDEVLPEVAIVEKLTELERDHPVAARAPSATAMVIGSGLVGYGMTRTKGIPRAILVAVGATVLANGLAGLSVTELLRTVRANRPHIRW